MKTELFLLMLTALITALFWVPYIGDRIVELGAWHTLQNPALQNIAQSSIGR